MLRRLIPAVEPLTVRPTARGHKRLSASPERPPACMEIAAAASARWKSAVSACRCERKSERQRSELERLRIPCLYCFGSRRVVVLHNRSPGRSPPPVRRWGGTLCLNHHQIGVIAYQTGPLSFMGIADANVCKEVVDYTIRAACLSAATPLCLEDGGQR